MIEITIRSGDASDMNQMTQGEPKDGGTWPVLRAAQDFDCDGINRVTERPCVLGDHRGFHRDEVGAEWLDDGTEDRPQWLDQRPYDPRD
ncbi:hypothetical protein [Kribbella sp. NPDC003557]|uniref:hypothetical protein n=1 Tax=Kribbella sp. NPDC003557 TaxID=3154449 RepID=UPI0033A3B6B7